MSTRPDDPDGHADRGTPSLTRPPLARPGRMAETHVAALHHHDQLMTSSDSSSPDPGAAWEALEEFVAPYEAAQEAAGGDADLAGFVPPGGHPRYAEVVRELARVELEYAWERGRPRRVEDYLA